MITIAKIIPPENKIDSARKRLKKLAKTAVLKNVTDLISVAWKLSVELDNSVNHDPADRIIAATSLVEDAPLVTADKNLIKAKSINTIW